MYSAVMADSCSKHVSVHCLYFHAVCCSRVDEAADVYSLGCIMYECLARQQPFGHLAEGGKSFNVLFKVTSQLVLVAGPCMDECMLASLLGLDVGSLA